MTVLSRAQATAILRSLGWRVRTTSEYVTVVRHFQGGWNLGPELDVDGSVGPDTSAALLLSESRRRAGKPTASAHFSFSEVACRCDGQYSSCPRIWQKRSAFRMMEGYRSKSGRPLDVVSACRCPSRNAAVGGSPTSRHLTGRACDVEPFFSVETVKSWQVATHIGFGSSSRRVKHIDKGSAATVVSPTVYVNGA
ncbi:D-Ala-D-Ala carboxypeptidase family metallohydrolase [Oryzobacter telluris]|uniref:D-Ala-D-Ala carboxypeptidase family metallohydrolase n=1 Tax=Oryzobacter telluris TaxID=3149179 RepID=UPI00370D2F6E